MSAGPRFGCTFVAVPVVLIGLGVMLFSAGRQLAPGDEAAARVFRTDPSCSANLTAAAAPGACTVVDAIVLSAEMRVTGFGRTRVHTPMVSVRFADGTIHEAELDGSAGDVFVYGVLSGARARAQSFRGTLVRVASGDSAAETVSAPDVGAETDREMPWGGVASILAALLIVIARFRFVRRSRAR